MGLQNTFSRKTEPFRQFLNAPCWYLLESLLQGRLYRRQSASSFVSQSWPTARDTIPRISDGGSCRTSFTRDNSQIGFAPRRRQQWLWPDLRCFTTICLQRPLSTRIVSPDINFAWCSEGVHRYDVYTRTLAARKGPTLAFLGDTSSLVAKCLLTLFGPA
jgi:hypothetical protein